MSRAQTVLNLDLTGLQTKPVSYLLRLYVIANCAVGMKNRIYSIDTVYAKLGNKIKQVDPKLLLQTRTQQDSYPNYIHIPVLVTRYATVKTLKINQVIIIVVKTDQRCHSKFLLQSIPNAACSLHFGRFKLCPIRKLSLRFFFENLDTSLFGRRNSLVTFLNIRHSVKLRNSTSRAVFNVNVI